MKSAFLTVFCFVIYIHSFAQEQKIEQFTDSLFASLLDGIRPGSAIAIIKDGQTLVNKGYGYANLEHQIKITPETVFDLASVSKQFCGYAISKLVQEGKINLQDSIQKFVPELPNFGRTITIDHLVHHVSGIRDWASAMPVAGWSFDDVISFDQILRFAYQQQGLNFIPGAEYIYSNTGYNLLAKVVETVSGVSFSEWIAENIFTPLQMNNSLFLSNADEVIPNRALGYYEENGSWNNKANRLTALGSSSMYSTTTDLTKWMSHLASPTDEDQEVITRMFDRGILNNGDTIAYAFGLSISEYRGTKRIAHSGSWAMFRTYVCYFPEHDLSVIVLNNHPGYAAGKAMQLADFFIPKQMQSNDSKALTSIQLTDSQLSGFTGTYKLGPAWYVNITNENGQLWTQATKEMKFIMTPVGDTLFRIDAYGGRTMAFLKNEQGMVDHMIYDNLDCPKVEHLEGLTNDYSGTYKSDELDTEYVITGNSDSLSMAHLRLGEFELTRAHNDDFSGNYWFIGSVEFERNKHGEVIGFYVSSGRARNQWFYKK